MEVQIDHQYYHMLWILKMILMNQIQISMNLILIEVGIKQRDIKEEKDIGKIFKILQVIIRVTEMVEIVQVVGNMDIIIIIEVDIIINIREIMDGIIMKKREIWADLEEEEGDNNKIKIKLVRED